MLSVCSCGEAGWRDRGNNDQQVANNDPHVINNDQKLLIVLNRKLKIDNGQLHTVSTLIPTQIKILVSWSCVWNLYFGSLVLQYLF
jgi:hypothetical protein